MYHLFLFQWATDAAQATTLAWQFQHSAEVTSSVPTCDIGSGWPCPAFTPEAWTRGQRVGEANNPGPQHYVRLSTSNPGGCRGKEPLIASLGPGIHMMSETHISQPVAATVSRQLRALASKEGRQIRTLYGCHSALRANSDWAGTWTGVATFSDFACKSVNLPWPPDMWEASRVQATAHQVGHHQIVMCNVYGYPRGPTWPKAASLTNQLLSPLTQHIVAGYGGLAAIGGDFNFNPDQLEEFDVWRSFGWAHAQQLAADKWNMPIQATCKGSTQRDHLWLSPALAALCREVHTFDIFADHCTVAADFDITLAAKSHLAWPLPTKIPWEEIQIPQWHATSQPFQHFTPGMDPTEFYRQFSQNFEDSIGPHYNNGSNHGLPRSCKGRGQRTTPSTRHTTPPFCRASRPGEVELAYDLPGQAVLRWYRQLRRLQSFLHAARASSQAPTAQQYRAELWASIRRASGFNTDFTAWWNQQDHARHIGQLPVGPPSMPQAEWIYAAFTRSFRSFEHWHHRQRSRILSSKRATTSGVEALYKSIRDPHRDQIESLWEDKDFTVLAVDPAEGQLHIDDQASSAPTTSWHLDGVPFHVTGTNGDLIDTDNLVLPEPGEVLTQRTHYDTPEEIHEQLSKLWKPRWLSTTSPSQSDWDRIISFVQAFMPTHHFEIPSLTPESWKRSVRRFKPQAARGADGYHKLDLQNMPAPTTTALLSLFDAIEQGQTDWPTQMLEGFVIALAKTDMAHEPTQFRPIVLLSILYRCWSSHRSRQLLSQIRHHMHTDAYGFIPGKEPAQIWLSLQSQIEVALLSGHDYCGLSTDVEKAFNNIRRQPLFALASHLGVPDKILQPWRSFLQSFRRRFRVHNQLGPAHISDIGFPEGCPLSVAAMAMLDWAMHQYQNHFTVQARTRSFVDNITITSQQAQHVAMAFFSIRSFLQLWGLSIDLAKTFTWGTTSQARRKIQQLALPVIADARELGGTLSYQKGHRNRLLIQRFDQITDKWARLRRDKAPLAHKLYMLPSVFWPNLLHGDLSCKFSDVHLAKFRTQAIKALRIQHGGGNPILRLSLSHRARLFQAASYMASPRPLRVPSLEQ